MGRAGDQLWAGDVQPTQVGDEVRLAHGDGGKVEAVEVELHHDKFSAKILIGYEKSRGQPILLLCISVQLPEKFYQSGSSLKVGCEETQKLLFRNQQTIPQHLCYY